MIRYEQSYVATRSTPWGRVLNRLSPKARVTLAVVAILALVSALLGAAYQIYAHRQIAILMAGEADLEATCRGTHPWTEAAARVASKRGEHVILAVVGEGAGGPRRRVLEVPNYRLDACARYFRGRPFAELESQLRTGLEETRELAIHFFQVNLVTYLEQRFDIWDRVGNSVWDTLRTGGVFLSGLIEGFSGGRSARDTLSNAAGDAWDQLGATQRQAEQERLARLLAGPTEALEEGAEYHMVDPESLRRELEQVCGLIVSTAAGEPGGSCGLSPDPANRLAVASLAAPPLLPAVAESHKLRDLVLQEVAGRLLPGAALPRGSGLGSKVMRGFGRVILAEIAIGIVDRKVNRSRVESELSETFSRRTRDWLDAQMIGHRLAIGRLEDAATRHWLEAAEAGRLQLVESNVEAVG